MRSANRCRYCPTASRLASLADLMRYSGTAGWTRTTDLLIHSKFSASDAGRHPPTRLVADPTTQLVRWVISCNLLTLPVTWRHYTSSSGVRHRSAACCGPTLKRKGL
jgi:hypothetical protein